MQDLIYPLHKEKISSLHKFSKENNVISPTFKFSVPRVAIEQQMQKKKKKKNFSKGGIVTLLSIWST